MKHKLIKPITITIALIFIWQEVIFCQSNIFYVLRPRSIFERQTSKNNINSIVERITEKIVTIIQKSQLTSADLNNLIWALTVADFPCQENGEFRQFTNEEIFEILEIVDAVLTQLKFGFEQEMPLDKKEALDEFREVLINKRRTLSLILPSLDRLINNLPIFFQTAAIGPDEFPVFLARDALTAAEFMRYCGLIANENISFSSIYQPGMPITAVVSDYVPDSKIALVQQVAELAKSRSIQKMQLAGKLPEKKNDPFYEVFHQEVYQELEQTFIEDIIRQMESNAELMKEAEILFKQMEHNGMIGHKNIVLMDMAVTGKTILYIKAVLKYFAQRRGIDSKNIRVFVGYSHDKKLCLPEVRLFNPEFDATGRPFRDQIWPFYRTGGDENSGMSFFKLHNKKYYMLMHVYRTLKLYNTALSYTQRTRPNLVGAVLDSLCSTDNTQDQI